VLFLEFQAGAGGLTHAVAAAGVPVLPPDEFTAGGVDFASRQDLENLRARLRRLRADGHCLVLHLAPPCATFSMARNRARRTQLRSRAHPAGLPRIINTDSRARLKEANRIAKESFSLAAWAHGELDAVVTLENPQSSYIWQFVDQSPLELGSFEDRTFSQCRYGTAYRKDTRLRIWGAGFHGMNLRCTSDGTRFSCGRTVAEGHAILGFGGESTAAAAAYPRGVCEAWAQCIASLARAPTAADRVVMTGEGRVHRHIDRGSVDPSRAETRKLEDLACRAGMRNPHRVIADWPHLARAMDPVYRAL